MAAASVVVAGAGKIGQTIADLLAHSGDYRVTVIDRSPEALTRLPGHASLRIVAVDFADASALAAALAGHGALINAAPFSANAAMVSAASRAGLHYLDLSEDVATEQRIRELAAVAPRAHVPQCGLAPGFITLAAMDLFRRFDSVQDLRMRVGALPLRPQGALGYALGWSTDGLINEYCELCDELVEGQHVQVPGLSQCEPVLIDGVRYEAFSTSGGIGSLCETLAGRVRNLSYRTLRYPGHAALMRFLLDELRLRERRELLKELLEHAVPATHHDVVVVMVTATGLQQQRLTEESYVNHIHGRVVHGTMRSAIQLTTASAVCAVLDLLLQGRLPQAGLVRQEDIPLSVFLDNRFGAVYRPRGRA